MRILLATFLLIICGPVLAGPWCLARDGVDNCRFISADDCYSIAINAGGDCRPNPQEMGDFGNARYCVLTAAQRLCTFNSSQQCLRVARENNGGCVRNAQLDLERRAQGQKKADESEFDFIEVDPETGGY